MPVILIFNYSIRIVGPTQRWLEPGFLELRTATRTGNVGWFVLGQSGNQINYNDVSTLVPQPSPYYIRIYCEGSYIKQ